MSKQILDALAQLEVSNDNHWTDDGLPRVDTVRLLAGNQSISRDDITKANPEFNRAVAALAAQEGEQTPEADTEEEGNEGNDLQGEEELTEEEGAEPEAGSGKFLGLGGDVIAAATEKMDAAKALLDAAQQKYREAQQELDNAIDAAAETKETVGDAIAGYLQGQRDLLEQRGARARALKEAGITLRDIKNLVPSKAPIDQAMARKNSRGAKRPGSK